MEDQLHNCNLLIMRLPMVYMVSSELFQKMLIVGLSLKPQYR